MPSGHGVTVHPTTPSILITDDDVGFRDTLRALFEPRGFRTLVAGDGEEALRILAGEDVHLLLLDMHMPKLTGLETIQRVRLIRSRMPCILLSARVDDNLIRQAKAADAYSILSKPVSRFTITDTVERALRGSYDWQF